jgi:thiamine-phosphate pyrophosphorylase
MLRLVTAHSLREIGASRRARADAILLSPVFATRTHLGARTLGPLRFRLLAARAQAPVIALGGMDARRAKRLRIGEWAAIDGICAKASRWIRTDS